jgi:AcrR family transcriptional regulator
VTKAKEEWFLAGMELLVSVGARGLSIDRLCRRMGKTKGSFYHHFSGREDFCQSLMRYWETTHTDDLIQATSRGEAHDALGELGKLARSLPFDRENAFREWASISEQAAEVVRRVDLRRVEHVKCLYEDKGHPPDRAQSLAWLEYCLLLGGAQLKDVFGDEERREAHRLLRELENRT